MPAVQTSPGKERLCCQDCNPGVVEEGPKFIPFLAIVDWKSLKRKIYSQQLDFAHNGRESSVPLTYGRESTKGLYSQPLEFTHNGRESSVTLTYGRESTKGLYSQPLDLAHNGRESSVTLTFRILYRFFAYADANILLV